MFVQDLQMESAAWVYHSRLPSFALTGQAEFELGERVRDRSRDVERRVGGGRIEDHALRVERDAA